MSLTPLPAWVARANAEEAYRESLLTPKIRRAIAKYGEAACIKAYYLHTECGEGAATIALTGPATIKTTRQADAAICAGAALAKAAWGAS